MDQSPSPIPSVLLSEGQSFPPSHILRLIIDSFPHQIVWKDTQGRFLGCNRAFAEVMGLDSPEGIVGLRDGDLPLYTSDEAAHLQHRDMQVMIAGEPDLYSIESQPHGDGGRRWMSVSRFPLRSPDREVRGVLSILEDMSDRLAAQQALVRGERYLMALVEVQRQLLQLTADWDQDRYEALLALLGKAALASRAYLYILVPGQPYAQQVAEWNSPGIEPTVGDARFTYLPTVGPFQDWFEHLSQGQPINQNYEQFSPEIQAILAVPPANVRSILLLPLMVRGQFYGTVGFSHCQRDGLRPAYGHRPWTRTEVTLLQLAATAMSLAIERAQASVSLRLAEQKYRSIFENAVEGIFQSTIDGHYLTVNPMLARIYGYPSPEALMATMQNIGQQLYVDPQRREVFVRQMLRQGSVLGFESQVYRRDGSTIWISESARVIYDDEGKAIGFEGTVEDITTRKQGEVELERRDRLLQGVAQASQHLLTSPDLETAIPRVLAILGEAADADRAYLYENHPHTETGEIAMSMRYEWVRSGISPSITQPHWQNLPYSAHGLHRWYRTFLAGQAIRSLVRQMPASEQALLEQDAILSIVMVPIFIDQTLWGYVGFDACRQPRRWSDNEESILVTISATLGGALNRQRAEAQMRHQAFHDTLTGLPNRVLFNEYLSPAIAQAERTGQHLAVLFVDLDRFKTINDTLGHAVGDLLLQQATQRLQQALREEDILARWGGDEFTLILPRLHAPEEAAKVAQRLGNLLKPPFLLAQQELYITSSIGIALYPQHGTDVSSLLRHADMAMYRAKAAGRNTYRFYRPTQGATVTTQLTLESHLHHALQNQELRLFFQPQLDLTTHTITQVEALLRWHHPQLGWVVPKDFIPLAEEIGLVHELGNWVFHAACRQVQQWQESGLGTIPVAINLSARQLQNRALPSQIATILGQYHLPPTVLELEITETAALLDVDTSIVVLENLRQLGVRIVMDDFGAGYSSLSYLKQLPIHGLKIDRSFVKEIPHSGEGVAMLRAIITLGQDLGLTVVAEGVETQEQLDCLRALGCHHIQGYWFSRPLPVAAMTQLLQQQAHG